MEGDCNVYAHSSLWMCPTRPDRYNAKMVYTELMEKDGVKLENNDTQMAFCCLSHEKQTNPVLQANRPSK